MSFARRIVMMKRIGLACLATFTMAIWGCASDEDASGFFDSAAPADAAGGEKNAGMSPPRSSAEEGSSDGTAAPSGNSNGPGAEAGVLTAGVWDDNLNFDFFQKYIDLSKKLGGQPTFGFAQRDAAQKKWAQRKAATELDVTFLIDTTGSMGDELTYLQREIDDIAQSIKIKHPQITPRFGLVVYKDNGDQYVTRSFDFEGLNEFRAHLGVETAGGGGDTPEAVAEGLGETMKLSWRAGAGTARLAFWVADAPHHMGQEQPVTSAIEAAMAKDVHLYPVAASGVDPLAELTMRTAAQLTGGRYVFLTDDSGVGNAHAEPHIPCYHVTKFNGALVRMVESELTGTHVQPGAGEILRSVGNPQGGKCATKANGSVTVY